MQHALAVLLVIVMGTTGAFAQELTKEDILKLKKAGVDDGLVLKILKAIGKRIELSSDDLVELTAANVGEEIITAMLRSPQEPPKGVVNAPTRPAAVEARTRLAVENTTSRVFWVQVKGERTVHFSSSALAGMLEVPRGKGIAVDVGPGGHTVSWDGAPVDVRLEIVSGRTVTLRVAEQEGDDCCGGPTLTVEVVKDAPKETMAQPLYTCPMHPEVTSREAGNCPKCGMKLELASPKKEGAGNEDR
ncbi:MAG: hypothetical protein HYY16_18065 [Planctomycetes bacterium]|nr:hypothetical protein [Planctomycetota bacterium]